MELPDDGDIPGSSVARCPRLTTTVQAALLIAGLVAVFLATPIVHGKWYIPADLTQASAGSHTMDHYSVQNSLQGDPATQMDPWLKWDSQQVHLGRIPLWNPDNAGGVPQVANYQSAVFSPFTVPFYVLPLRWAFIASAFLKLWCLGFFTYLLCRKHALGHLAGLLGATVFAFAGYQLIWLNWQHVGAGVTLPAGAWAAEVALQAEESRHRRWGLVGFGLAVALGLLAGHPETFFYAALALSAYVVFAIARLRVSVLQRLAWFARFGAFGALGALAAAIQLLPFFEYLHLSTQYATRSNVGIGGGIQPAGKGLLAFPMLLGSPASSYNEPNYAFGNFLEANGDYVGLVAMGLALVGLVGLRSARRRIPATVGLGAAACGWALFHVARVGSIATHTPVLKLSTVNRSHDIWIFGVAMLAAVGLEVLIEHARGRASRRMSIGVSAALAGAWSALIAISWHWAQQTRAAQRSAAHTTIGTPFAKSYVHTHIEFVLAVTAIAAAGTMLLAAGPNFAGRLKPVVATAAAVMIVASSYAATALMFRGFNPSVSSDVVYASPRGVAAAQDQATDLNVLRAPDLANWPDTNLWHGERQLTSYDALGVLWFERLFTHVMRESLQTFGDEGDPACAEALRLFGVTQVWSYKEQPFSTSGVAESAKNGPDATLAHLPLVHVFGSVQVLGVPSAVGRFGIVPRTTVSPDEDVALGSVSSCSYAVGQIATLLAPGAGKAGTGQVPAGYQPIATSRGGGQQVRVLGETPGHIRLAVSDGPGGLLVARQTWFPGWRATVDGHSAPLWRADYAFQGVPVSAGSHVVSLDYRPASFRTGAELSAIAVFALVIAASGIRFWTGSVSAVIDAARRRARVRASARGPG